MKKKLFLTFLLTGTIGLGLTSRPIEKTSAAQQRLSFSNLDVLENSFNSVAGNTIHFFRLKFKIDYLQRVNYSFKMIHPVIWGLQNRINRDNFTLEISDNETYGMGYTKTYNYSIVMLRQIGEAYMATPYYDNDDLAHYDPMTHYSDSRYVDIGSSTYYYYLTLVIPWNNATPPPNYQTENLKGYFANESEFIGFSMQDMLNAEQTGYNKGYNEGASDWYNSGFTNGYNSGLQVTNSELYDEAYQQGARDKFMANFDKWIVPAIIVIMFLGGFISVMSMRSNKG